jgi:hypothetical protein
LERREKGAAADRRVWAEQEKLLQSALQPSASTLKPAGRAALQRRQSSAFLCTIPRKVVRLLTVRREYLDISAGKFPSRLARQTFAAIESLCDVRVHKPPI